jgi:hypothetical protein
MRVPPVPSGEQTDGDEEKHKFHEELAGLEDGEQQHI